MRKLSLLIYLTFSKPISLTCYVVFHWLNVCVVAPPGGLVKKRFCVSSPSGHVKIPHHPSPVRAREILMTMTSKYYDFFPRGIVTRTFFRAVGRSTFLFPTAHVAAQRRTRKSRPPVVTMTLQATVSQMNTFWSVSSPWALGFVLVMTVAWITFMLLRHKTFSLRGRFVLITGCDSGFGREIASRLDRLGCCVMATCLTQKGAEELKNASSERMNVYLMDVTNSAQIQETYAEVRKKLREADTDLWGLVNNAGILCWGPIEWYPLETFKRLADVNLWGMVDVTKTFLPLIKAAKGRVVNFSSIAGRISFPNHGPYTITKYGVEAFSDTLRREMAAWGVGISIIEAVGFKTRMMSPQIITNHAEKAWNNLSEEMKAEYGQDFMNKRLSTMAKQYFDGTVSADLFEVVDAVVDALAAHHPRARYVIGPYASVVTFITQLPTQLEDWVLKKISTGSAIEAAKGPLTNFNE